VQAVAFGVKDRIGMETAVPGSVLEGGEAARMSSIKPRLGLGLAAGWNGPVGQIAPQPRSRTARGWMTASATG
jgi:3-(3-hydroxy-phenyl)propionate hydroxylase